MNKYLKHFEEFPKENAVVKPAAIINGTSALCALLMMHLCSVGQTKPAEVQTQQLTVRRKGV